MQPCKLQCGRMKGLNETETPTSVLCVFGISKGNLIGVYLYSLQLVLTLRLLNTTCPVLANSVDPDQLASEEAN